MAEGPLCMASQIVPTRMMTILRAGDGIGREADQVGSAGHAGGRRSPHAHHAGRTLRKSAGLHRGRLPQTSPRDHS
jgi:hypothetical protein